MGAIASQITSLTIVYSTVNSDADQRNIKDPRHWPLCGDFTGTGEFPAQRASYAENVFIWWRHHVLDYLLVFWNDEKNDMKQQQNMAVWLSHGILVDPWWVWLWRSGPNRLVQIDVTVDFIHIHVQMICMHMKWPHVALCLSIVIWTNTTDFFFIKIKCITLRWRHNGCDGVSNHPPHDCLLNALFRRRSKKTSKLRVTGLCAGNSPGEFPAQMASIAENVSIWWRHHDHNTW